MKKNKPKIGAFWLEDLGQKRKNEKDLEQVLINEGVYNKKAFEEMMLKVPEKSFFNKKKSEQVIYQGDSVPIILKLTAYPDESGKEIYLFSNGKIPDYIIETPYKEFLMQQIAVKNKIGNYKEYFGISECILTLDELTRNIKIIRNAEKELDYVCSRVRGMFGKKFEQILNEYDKPLEK